MTIIRVLKTQWGKLENFWKEHPFLLALIVAVFSLAITPLFSNGRVFLKNTLDIAMNHPTESVIFIWLFSLTIWILAKSVSVRLSHLESMFDTQAALSGITQRLEEMDITI